MDMQSSSYQTKKYPALEVTRDFLIAGAVSRCICNLIELKLRI
jgi:hypothetical protein